MTRINESVRIRPMTRMDVAQVIEIAASLKQAPRWPPDAYLKALNPAALPSRVAIAAEDAVTGTIFGFAVASLTAAESELETIAVASEFQRSGIARRLLGKMVEMLQGMGATVIALEVRASNHPAHALYQLLGFTESGRRPRYYADPIEDAVLMTLSLTAGY